MLKLRGYGVVGAVALDQIGRAKGVHVPAMEDPRVPGKRLPACHLDLEVRAEGPTHVLVISDSRVHLPAPAGPLTSTPSPSTACSAPAPTGPPLLAAVGVELNGVGVSLVGERNAEEVLYACFQGLHLRLARSRREQRVEAGIERVQVDNPLRRSAHPVLLALPRRRDGSSSTLSSRVRSGRPSERDPGLKLAASKLEGAAEGVVALGRLHAVAGPAAVV